MAGRSRLLQPMWLAAGAMVVGTVAVVAVVMASGSGHGGPAAAPPRAAAAPGQAPLATPLATSTSSTAGTWATVPMGHLGHPLNTFWQLFGQVGGSGPWTNHVEATAVATNGGLVLSGSAPGGLTVGVLPSQMLTYSPLVATSDGSSWSTGVLGQGLAARPSALANGPDGTTAALVTDGRGLSVLTSDGDLSAWHRAVTERQLAHTAAGRRCGVTDLTAVGFVDGQLAVGASCARPGVAGLLVDRSDTWQAGGPPVPVDAPTEVLALVQDPGGTTVLLGTRDRSATTLAAAWTGPDGTWTTSPGLRLPSADHLASIGPADGNGVFALVSTAPASGRPTRSTGSAASSEQTGLLVAGGPGTGWNRLGPVPTGTATVAFDATTIDALAVDDTHLTVWGMPVTGGTWSPLQTLTVAVPFNSSQ